MFSSYSPFSLCLSHSPAIHFLSNTKKFNTHFNCKNSQLNPCKSQEGNLLLTPLLSFTHLNSYLGGGSRRLSQSCLHMETLRSTMDRGSIETNEENQPLDLFKGNRRLLANEEVEDKDFMANEKAPTKIQEGFVEFVEMGCISGEIFETESTCLKECRRIPLENSATIVDSLLGNSGTGATEVDNFDFSVNGRTSTKDEVGIVSSIKNNSELPIQDEIGYLSLEKNGRVNPSHSLRTVEVAERNDRLCPPEVKLSDSADRGGTTANLVTEDEAEFIECAAQICGFDTREDTEIVFPLKGSVGSDFHCVGERYGRLAANEKMKVVDSIGRRGKSVVLDIADKIRRIPAGEKIDAHDLLGRCSEHPTLFDFNNLLGALVKADRPESAANLFSNISSYGFSPDSRTFSIMVQCFCAKKEPDEARDVMLKMIDNGFCPNVVTFTILVDAFCQRGRLQKAVEIFNTMYQIGCEPTIQTYNCLINGLCFVGRIEEAYELLTKIKKSSKKPDIYTFTALMNGFCKVGCSNQAMELLEEAEKLGLKPTVVTFNTIFDGYCREGKPLYGIGLLRKMEEKGCQPDLISYSTLLHGLVKWNETDIALEVYKKMCGAGFKPDERVMNTLLRRLCRKSLTDKKLLKDAEELFGRIGEMGSGPTPDTCCLMIQALAIRGKMDGALSILHNMAKTGNPPRAMTYNIVIKALCRKGRTDDAWLVLVLLINRQGPFPHRSTYNLLLDEFSRQGRLLDSHKVYALALKRGAFLHRKQHRIW